MRHEIAVAMPNIVYGVAAVIAAGSPETPVECAMPAVGVAALLVGFVPVLAAADQWPSPVDAMMLSEVRR